MKSTQSRSPLLSALNIFLTGTGDKFWNFFWMYIGLIAGVAIIAALAFRQAGLISLACFFILFGVHIIPLFNIDLMRLSNWRLLPNFVSSMRLAWLIIGAAVSLCWLGMGIFGLDPGDANTVLAFMFFGLGLYLLSTGLSYYFDSVLMALFVLLTPVAVVAVLHGELPSMPHWAWLATFDLLLVSWLYWRWPQIAANNRKDPVVELYCHSLSWIQGQFKPTGQLGNEILYNGNFGLGKQILSKLTGSLYYIGLSLILLLTWQAWVLPSGIEGSKLPLVFAIALYCWGHNALVILRVSSAWLFLPLDREQIFYLLEKLAMRELALKGVLLLMALLYISGWQITFLLLPAVVLAMQLQTLVIWHQIDRKENLLFILTASLLSPLALLIPLILGLWLLALILPLLLAVLIWIRPRVAHRMQFMDWRKLRFQLPMAGGADVPHSGQ